jgi:hypothetical protein
MIEGESGIEPDNNDFTESKSVRALRASSAVELRHRQLNIWLAAMANSNITVLDSSSITCQSCAQTITKLANLP